MLEPSKPIPSSKRSAVSSAAGIEKCCHSPCTSTNLKSTISTLFFLTKSKASLTAMLFALSFSSVLQVLFSYAGLPLKTRQLCSLRLQRLLQSMGGAGSLGSPARPFQDRQVPRSPFLC